MIRPPLRSATRLILGLHGYEPGWYDTGIAAAIAAMVFLAGALVFAALVEAWRTVIA